jgi:subtilisin family serine protease
MGIAAGSGYDTPYRGIAWGSDLCVVGNAISANVEYVDSADRYKYTTATDALGFKYCFDYAEAQGKPCVVSFSEGYPPYLDDEDSLFAVTLEQLTGPGRIIVASAGNEGVEMTYFEKRPDQQEAGSFVRSFKKGALYRIKSEGEMRLVVYGYGEESGKRKEERGMPSDTIAFETDEVPIDTIIRRKIAYGEDSLTVVAYRDSSRFADHDIWQLLLEADTTLNLLPPLAVVVQGQGKIEVYGSSSNAFCDDDIDVRWRDAMKGRNVFAPGCFPGVLCVGATTHRLSILNAQGEVVNGSKETEAGKIGYYSSTGPAMNDLMKPDVVAPGTNVVASYSSLFHPEKEVVAYSDYQGERYPWGVQSGTSMSTPVVAGAIALWLQAKPDLTPQEVREVMLRSCRHPEEKYDYPNDVYGYGEVDVYRGLLEVLSLSGIEDISMHQPKGVQVFPVEGGLRLVFDRMVREPVRVRVYNLSGVCVYEKRVADQTTLGRRLLHEDAIAYSGGETITFVALPSVLSGVYVVQVETADKRLQGSELVRL